MPVPQLDVLISARAVNSPDGKGAIVQSLDGLYQLDCDESGCSWSILSHKLTETVNFPLLFNLPEK